MYVSNVFKTGYRNYINKNQNTSRTVNRRTLSLLKKCYRIAYHATLHQIPNDTDINNNRSPYGLQKEQITYRIVSYKRPRYDKCKTIQTRKLTA